MSKHTQGEWYVSAGLQVVSKNGNIAKVWAKGNGEGSSNARLIATAPELLGACQFAVMALAAASERDPSFNRDYEKVSAAIAKAIGE